MTYSMNDFFDFDKAIPLEQFLEELEGMAGAFANNEDVETDEETTAEHDDWSFCYFTAKMSR